VAHGGEVAQGEVHANPEHQENNANLGQFPSKLGIRNKSWRERPNHNTGEQIPDERWEAQTVRCIATDAGIGQAHGNSRDQYGLVWHDKDSLAAVGRKTQLPLPAHTLSSTV
jgi:hypothetical protein